MQADDRSLEDHVPAKAPQIDRSTNVTKRVLFQKELKHGLPPKGLKHHLIFWGYRILQCMQIKTGMVHCNDVGIPRESQQSGLKHRQRGPGPVHSFGEFFSSKLGPSAIRRNTCAQGGRAGGRALSTPPSRLRNLLPCSKSFQLLVVYWKTQIRWQKVKVLTAKQHAPKVKPQAVS